MKTTTSIQTLVIGLTAAVLFSAAPPAPAQGRVPERNAATEKVRVPVSKEQERRQPTPRQRSVPIGAGTHKGG
jgi:hypothetical protein